MLNSTSSAKRKPFQPVTPNTQPLQRTPKSRTAQVFESATRPNGKSKTPKTLEKTTPIHKRGRKKEDLGKYREIEPATKIAKAHAIATPLEEERYDGLYVNGLRHGEGTLVEPNGDTYVGPFKMGKKHGLGTVFYVNGDKFSGQFVEDVSIQGTLIRENGDILELKYQNARGDGQLSIRFANKDKLEAIYNDGVGNGILVFANGDKYVGEFSGELPHGEGTLIYANGNRYVGPFYQGKVQGEGTLYYANGDKYVGDFLSDVAHGRGTLLYANGDNYMGEFKEGQANGQGSFTYSNGCSYIGRMLKGIPHGRGTLDLKSQNQIDGPFLRWTNGNYVLGNIYIGEFQSGRFTCREGIIHYKNGDRYVGQCLNEMPHGQGTLFLNNGSKYEGAFHEGKKHGLGKMTFINQHPTVGNFINDLFDVNSARQDWEEESSSN